MSDDSSSEGNPLDPLNWGSTISAVTAEAYLNPPALKNDELMGVWTTFDANIDRVRKMLILPDLVGEVRAIYQHCLDVAIYRATGTLDVAQKFDEESSEISLIRENTTHTLKEWQEKQPKRPVDELFAKAHDVELFKQNSSRGTVAMTLIQSGDAQFADGIEALLASCVTALWTSFETFAGDLWETALNVHPSVLAGLSGKNRCHQREGDKENRLFRSGDDGSNDEGKRIDLDSLGKYQWNLAKSMGTNLKQRYRFTSLDGIRTAYGEAFSKDNKEIDCNICSETFDILSALRNCIIHKAGIADKEYFQRTKRLSYLPKAQIGEKLKIDGQIVAWAIVSTSIGGRCIAEAVDNWIDNRPKEKP
jgi:hypothetical protein